MVTASDSTTGPAESASQLSSGPRAALSSGFGDERGPLTLRPAMARPMPQATKPTHHSQPCTRNGATGSNKKGYASSPRSEPAFDTAYNR